MKVATAITLPGRMAGQSNQPTRQGGVVLFIALIVLVALTLGGLALIRSASTGILAAGNLALRQNAAIAADAGVETAVAWIRTQTPAALENNMPAFGYYAGWDTAFNPFTSTLWGPTTSALANPTAPTDAAGNTVRFVIHRMCEIAGSPTTAPCVALAGASAGTSRGGAQTGERALTGTTQVYYRVTARVEGPKNTVSYVQAMIY